MYQYQHFTSSFLLCTSMLVPERSHEHPYRTFVSVSCDTGVDCSAHPLVYIGAVVDSYRGATGAVRFLLTVDSGGTTGTKGTTKTTGQSHESDRKTPFL